VATKASVTMAVDGNDKTFSFQPLIGKKFVSLSGKDLQDSLMKWYFKILYLNSFIIIWRRNASLLNYGL